MATIICSGFYEEHQVCLQVLNLLGSTCKRETSIEKGCGLPLSRVTKGASSGHLTLKKEDGRKLDVCFKAAWRRFQGQMLFLKVHSRQVSWKLALNYCCARSSFLEDLHRENEAVKKQTFQIRTEKGQKFVNPRESRLFMNENFYQHQSVQRHVQPNVGRRNKSIYYEVYIKSMFCFFFIENKRNSLIIKRFVLIYIAVNTSPYFFSGASKVCLPSLLGERQPRSQGSLVQGEGVGERRNKLLVGIQTLLPFPIFPPIKASAEKRVWHLRQ